MARGNSEQFKPDGSKPPDPVAEILRDQANREFLPGYTRLQADTHFKELCRNDSWSERDIQFLLEYERLKDKPVAKMPEPEQASLVKPVTITGNVEQDRFMRASTDNPAPLSSGTAERQSFKLGANAEQIAWRDWQERLNHSIFDKMQSLVKDKGFPAGLQCQFDYTIKRDGTFQWEMTSQSGNDNYDQAVSKAIDDTLRYHPELCVFPKGSKRSEYTRRGVTFTVGEADNYTTRTVDDEINRT